MPFVPKPPDPDEENFLGCHRFEDRIEGTSGQPGECADCGAKVFVSDSSQELIAKHALVVLCMACMTERMEADDDVRIMPPSERQTAEVRAYFARRN